MIFSYKADYELKKANADDAGWDLQANETVTFKPGERKLVSTGCQINMGNTNMVQPYQYEAQLRGRSSMAMKGFLAHFGTIDHSYTREIKVMLFYFGEEEYTINKGDKVAQLVFAQVLPVKFTKVTEMEEKREGFGSSGK